MLYSVIIRNAELNNDWSISNDDYGNKFITNDSIHQRIRFGKNVESTLVEVKSINNNSENDSSFFKSYKLPSSIFFSNNNKNMNLNIVNFWSKNQNKKNTHVDQDILYVTVPTHNFKMLEYSVGDGVSVVQTYHMVGKYVGCAMTISNKTESIITIKGYDVDTRRYCIYTVGIVDDSVVTKVSNIVPRDDIKKLSNLNKKYSKFSLGFKMITSPGKLLTKAYIVDEKDFDKIREVTSNIKDSIIISLCEPDVNEFNDEDKEELKKIILNNNIRAITLCNVKLPKTFCKDFKILYMFNYDIEKNRLNCIRSN